MAITDSILDTIKKMLNVSETDAAFDLDIIVNINSAFMLLNQLGVGPEKPFYIEDSTETWNDFSPDIVLYQSAKPFVFLEVKMVFDPPGTSFTQEVMKQKALEYAWRLAEQYSINNYVPPVEPEAPLEPEVGSI